MSCRGCFSTSTLMHSCRASTRSSNCHIRLAKPLAINILAPQAPKAEFLLVVPPNLPATPMGKDGSRPVLRDAFFICSLVPGDTRLVSRGINFEFRSSQVKRFQRNWQVGEDKQFQASPMIHDTCLKTISPKKKINHPRFLWWMMRYLFENNEPQEKHMIGDTPICCWFCKVAPLQF